MYPPSTSSHLPAHASRTCLRARLPAVLFLCRGSGSEDDGMAEADRESEEGWEGGLGLYEAVEEEDGNASTAWEVGLNGSGLVEDEVGLLPPGADEATYVRVSGRAREQASQRLGTHCQNREGAQSQLLCMPAACCSSPAAACCSSSCQLPLVPHPPSYIPRTPPPPV